MSSNGLLQRAVKGKCRKCFRVRNTSKYLDIVGEVSHGYATGYIWECKDRQECKETALQKIAINHKHKQFIEISLEN